jgi:hypothetical protein
MYLKITKYRPVHWGGDYESYVEEKQPVMSLIGDSVDSIPTISKVEKIGFKPLFLFIGFFFFLDKGGISGQEDWIRKANFPI